MRMIDLSKCITDKLQTSQWIIDLELLSLLKDYAEDTQFQQQWSQCKIQAKQGLIRYIYETQGIQIPEHFLFDVMIKRFHEYKRQLMNAMYCIYRYQWIKSLSREERKHIVPRAVIVGGKVFSKHS